MILSYFLSTTLALGVNSFLIPGNVDAFDSSKTLDSPALLNKEQTFTLDCASCPYALNSQRNGGHEWTNDVQSDLRMTIDADKDTLRLNGVPFYPIEPASPPQLHVSQIKKDGEDPTFEGYPGDLRLSYGLEYEENKADDGNSVIKVVMTVLALDGQMVRVDNVEIRTIKKADGQLILHSVVSAPAEPNPLDAKCTNTLCRAFAKILSGIHKAKAAAKATCYNMKCLCVKCYKSITGAIKHLHHKPSHVTTVPSESEDKTVKLPTHNRFRPMMGRPAHHAHHRKGALHRMGHVMWSTIKVAFMPILIGIAFGMAASAIGMIVGQLLVHLWMKYRRTEHVIYIPVDTDEKSGLPAYEDFPTQEAMDRKEAEANA